MTISERYFERFCERRGIAFTRLPEGAVKMPDYEILVEGIRIAVEVKQIEPNAEDRDILAQAAHGEAASYWVDMSRARQSIRDAIKQLRAYVNGGRPAVVVLYEVVELLGHLQSDNCGVSIRP